jgi:uncharacterized protein YifN (PemK superfamily)
MAITFIPERGRILMCDYDLAGVPPEMEKARRVVVISPTKLNHRHAGGPGLAVVVPLSATPPTRARPYDVFFPAGVYQSLAVDTWARCATISHVSHSRLERVWSRQAYIGEIISAADMRRLEAGLLLALGIAVH